MPRKKLTNDPTPLDVALCEMAAARLDPDRLSNNGHFMYPSWPYDSGAVWGIIDGQCGVGSYGVCGDPERFKVMQGHGRVLREAGL